MLKLEVDIILVYPSLITVQDNTMLKHCFDGDVSVFKFNYRSG